jgi:recombination protein RecA
MKLAEKEKAAKASLKDIESTFGAGVAYQFGSGKMADREAFSTGCLDLDLKLRIGGFPRTMMTELYGKEGGGKSTLCMTAVGIAQAQGELAAYIDVENAFNPQYARKLGVNIQKLIFSQPDSGEQALQIAETLIDGGGVSLIVVDSVASLVPQAELDGEIGDSNVALLSRLMSSALGRLGIKVRKQNVALIFINQLRDVINASAFGEKTNTPGGRKLKHLASLRMNVSRIAQIKDGDKVIGGRTQVSIRKSRICSPYQDAEFDLIYGIGISKETDLIDVAEGMGIIKKEGNSYLYGEAKLGVGRERTRAALQREPELFAQLRQVVLRQAEADRENEDRAQSE